MFCCCNVMYCIVMNFNKLSSKSASGYCSRSFDSVVVVVVVSFSFLLILRENIALICSRQQM